MESDPNVLLALAAALIGKITSTQSTGPTVHRFTDGHDINRPTLPVLVNPAAAGTEPTFLTTHRTINSDDVNNDTAAILDSIASICVSRPSDQIVAVALEMDVGRQVAVLTIAHNYGTGPDLIAYLNGQWRLMCIMSNQCAKLGRGDSRGRLSPPIELVEPWRTEFIKRVYLFCGKKSFECIDSHWRSLTSFMNRFERHQFTLTGDQLFKGQFIDALYSLKATRQFLHQVSWGGSLTDREWDCLICLMDGAVVDVDSLLDTTLFETWADEIKFIGGPLYPLRDTVVQLITEHRPILDLLRFSQCPRSRPTFLCQMTIREVPSLVPVYTSLPNTRLCWQSLIEYVCGENLITSYTWLSQEVSNAQKSRSAGRVHRVCALIAYLETASKNSRPPFNYIGSSSLTCGACHAWIRAFNLVGGRQYRTRGTNGDWSVRSVMAELPLIGQSTALAGYFTPMVAEACVEFWTAKGHVYPASESVGPPGDLPESTPTPSAAELRRSLLNQETRGGRGFGS